MQNRSSYHRGNRVCIELEDSRSRMKRVYRILLISSYSLGESNDQSMQNLS